jgi:anti-sigma factor RsiW
VTAQAVHLDRDLLSAYLDRELPAREAARVEDHLAACPGCRARLDGLARVVGALARLERTAPPPSLAQHVERRVALEVDRRGWVADVERRLSTFAPQSPLLVGFTLTIALAVILYLYTVWAATPQRSDVTLRPAPTEAARSLLDRVEGRRLGGRELVRRGDEWREVSALGAVPERTVDTGSEEAAELVARHPWLAELLAEGTTVVFRDGEEVVALRRAVGEELPAP